MTRRPTVPHAIHTGERNYIETNCFTDIISELLHARGDEPVASFGSFVRMDFENDQWTFFKPRPEDMELLYGLDIHEIQPYRSIPHQVAEQLAPRPDDDDRARRLVSPGHRRDQLSATAHVKTGVIAEAIDLERELFRYYHNASLYELVG